MNLGRGVGNRDQATLKKVQTYNTGTHALKVFPNMFIELSTSARSSELWPQTSFAQG